MTSRAKSVFGRLFRMPKTRAARGGVVAAQPRQRARADGGDEPRTVEIEKVYKRGIRGEVARETPAHREDILHPFHQERLAARSLEGEMPVEDPRGRGSAEERNDACAVAVPVQQD